MQKELISNRLHVLFGWHRVVLQDKIPDPLVVVTPGPDAIRPIKINFFLILFTSGCIFYILLSIVSSGCGFDISLLGLKTEI